MNAAVARSYLFVPGDRPDRFDKAWASAADAVILDLEDAVAPAQKVQARAAVTAWLDPARPVWIRINAADTPWFADDLAIVRQSGVAGVLLPKAESIPPSLIDGLNLIPIVETAAGLRAAGALASPPGVVRLAFGALDFGLDLGIEDDGDALASFRSQLVLESRLAGLAAPIDGVTLAIDDESLVQSDSERARRLGFGGKLCIHPQQIVAVNRAFSPSAQERQWAERVLAAMQASGGAAVALDGQMIDRPVWLKAQRIANSPAVDRRLRQMT